MSADDLRRAAALMRERAAAVVDECGVTSADDAPWFNATDFYASTSDEPDPVHAHVASWRPAVALAVADWLDAVADRCLTIHNSTPAVWYGALAVARAYLRAAS